MNIVMSTLKQTDHSEKFRKIRDFIVIEGWGSELWIISRFQMKAVMGPHDHVEVTCQYESTKPQ
jgi:hypothetical protein